MNGASFPTSSRSVLPEPLKAGTVAPRARVKPSRPGKPGSVNPAAKSIRSRVVCLRPPKAGPHETGFGLQDNTRGDWILHPGSARPHGNLHFTCECVVKRAGKRGVLNFRGPFVQGPPAARFLYLSWKPKNWRPGQPEPGPPLCVRRIKVHLSTISWRLIETALRTGAVLEATVAGTGKDGGPACASAPLLNGGWKLA